MNNTAKKRYKIMLPSGDFVVIWFIGSQLEKILQAYNIEYKIEK